MSNWQMVFKDRLEHRAGIVRDVLVDRSIEAVVVNKKDSLYGFGYFEVQVSPNDVILAIKIIQEDINFE
ncbi:MAG: hypothetical protein GY816_19860 [Cytophagales bacterium]|nr:hypothetical protein [Cytophagales bacterium]